MRRIAKNGRDPTAKVGSQPFGSQLFYPPQSSESGEVSGL
jgi:hypothetical protein